VSLASNHTSYVLVTLVLPTPHIIGLARTVNIYTAYDRIFGDFPAKMALANPTHRTPTSPPRTMSSLNCTGAAEAGAAEAGAAEPPSHGKPKIHNV